MDRQDLRSQLAQLGSVSLLLFLDSNALEINRVERLREGRDFVAFLHLTPALNLKFGLASDELLLFVLHAREQQRWFLTEVREKLRQYDRLSKAAVLIVSEDPKIVKLCSESYADSSTGYKTAHVPILSLNIRDAKTDEARKTLLFSAFKKFAFAMDHFDTRTPVPDDLFGRTATVSQIESHLRTSTEGVAILGMRRVGKTSIFKEGSHSTCIRS